MLKKSWRRYERKKHEREKKELFNIKNIIAEMSTKTGYITAWIYLKNKIVHWKIIVRYCHRRKGGKDNERENRKEISRDTEDK